DVLLEELDRLGPPLVRRVLRVAQVPDQDAPLRRVLHEGEVRLRQLDPEGRGEGGQSLASARHPRPPFAERPAHRPPGGPMSPCTKYPSPRRVTTNWGANPRSTFRRSSRK